MIYKFDVNIVCLFIKMGFIDYKVVKYVSICINFNVKFLF